MAICADMSYGANAAFTNDQDGNYMSAISLNQGYLTIPPGTYFTGDFTVSFWFFYKTIGYYPNIVSFSNGLGTNCLSLMFSDYEGIMHLLLYIPGVRQIDLVRTNNQFPFLAWSHVTFLLSGNMASIYFNGSLIVSKQISNYPISQFITKTNNNYLGINVDTNLNRKEMYLDAIIYDLKIFNKALTQTEISQNMNLMFNRTLVISPCETKKCGVGASCISIGGVATCSCPSGKTGDPGQLCCGKNKKNNYGEKKFKTII